MLLLRDVVERRYCLSKAKSRSKGKPQVKKRARRQGKGVKVEAIRRPSKRRGDLEKGRSKSWEVKEEGLGRDSVNLYASLK